MKSSTYQVPMRLSEINAEIYRERVAQASDFLEGHSREMMKALEEEMQKAAVKLDFEKAAELRNMLDDLRRTTKPMRRFTRHSLPTTIDPQADVQALAEALQLPRLPNVMECFDISNISTTRGCLDGMFREGSGQENRRYRIRTVEGRMTSRYGGSRARYARVLLQAREAHPDAAEFSQKIQGKRAPPVRDDSMSPNWLPGSNHRRCSKASFPPPVGIAAAGFADFPSSAWRRV